MRLLVFDQMDPASELDISTQARMYVHMYTPPPLSRGPMKPPAGLNRRGLGSDPTGEVTCYLFIYLFQGKARYSGGRGNIAGQVY